MFTLAGKQIINHLMALRGDQSGRHLGPGIVKSRCGGPQQLLSKPLFSKVG